MTKAKPLTLARKLKNLVDLYEAADAEIEKQDLIKKEALEAYKVNDGIEPAVVRKIIARRKKFAKDPAETQRLEDLMTDYQFMLGEGREGDARPWTQTDDEVARVVALTNTDKPPKIETIKKALGCSQGKAHKLRTLAATRLAKKSSSSRDDDEHEHSPPHDPDTGEINDREAANSSDDAGHRSEPSAPADMGITMSANAGPPLGQSAASLDSQGEQSGTHSGEINEIHRGATQPKGCAKVVRTDASMSESVAASGDAVRDASAMPLDVVAAPHSEGREHAGSAATAPPACVSGTHSGGYAQPVITRDVTTEPGGDAQDETGVGGNVCTDECSGRPTGAPVPESCGEPAAALGAKALARSCGLTTAPLRPHDTPSGGSSTGRTSPFQGEDAGSSPVPRSNNTALDTRGEARPSLEDSESTWFSTLQRSRQEGRV